MTTLTADDAEAIRRERARRPLPVARRSTRARRWSAEAANWNTQVQGASDELPPIRSWPLQFGSFFTGAGRDVRRQGGGARLGDPRPAVRRRRRSGRRDHPHQEPAVPGHRRADDARGRRRWDRTRTTRSSCRITTVQKRLLGVQHITGITISAADGVPLDAVSTGRSPRCCARGTDIQPGADDDFMVRTQEEMATMLTSTTDTMTYLLAGIAAVSLLVGGIGIMNIMLVSVTERTREIGLRLSVGARDLDVLTQFLVEAIVLSLAGGALGILLGFGGAYGVSRVDAVVDGRHRRARCCCRSAWPRPPACSSGSIRRARRPRSIRSRRCGTSRRAAGPKRPALRAGMNGSACDGGGHTPAPCAELRKEHCEGDVAPATLGRRRRFVPAMTRSVRRHVPRSCASSTRCRRVIARGSSARQRAAAHR